MTVPIRRFEPGASGEAFEEFLERLGLRTMKHGGSFKVWSPGAKKPRSLRKRAMIELLDRERVKAGLEPILKPTARLVVTRCEGKCLSEK